MVSMAQHSLSPQASTDFTSSSDLHSLLPALSVNYYTTSHQTTILDSKPLLDIDTL
uniref:Uncharacterized protein n=1 Tax=Theropithecus gelada TaxID=9565 RepID=A0A8D2FKT0_THEGE